ncbi:DUF6894 family protein [Bradyrhizobium sp. B120]|uniref:DUF6894 family protein n=1 Tax=Bradyrhizobium sp. B120 TaxID=3410088 RepID=UPI003B987A8C
MPRFFINHTSPSEICVDHIGVEFSSLEAAYLDTCEAALAIAFEKLHERQDPTRDAFEIIDEKQNLLMQVPFSEVLRPAAMTTKQANTLAFENCRRQIARSERLKDDIRAELTRTRGIFDAIRANLSPLRPV